MVSHARQHSEGRVTPRFVRDPNSPVHGDCRSLWVWAASIGFFHSFPSIYPIPNSLINVNTCLWCTSDSGRIAVVIKPGSWLPLLQQMRRFRFNDSSWPVCYICCCFHSEYCTRMVHLKQTHWELVEVNKTSKRNNTDRWKNLSFKRQEFHD